MCSSVYFGLITSVYTFFLNLATSGIFLSSTRLVSKEIATGSYANVKKAIRSCIFFSFTIGFFASVILILTSKFISQNLLQNQVNTIPFYVIAISLPFISIALAINGYFSAIRKSYKSAIAQIFEQFVKIFITTKLILFFLPYGISYACLALVLGNAISEILSFGFFYILYLLDISKIKLKASNKNYTKSILQISLPVAISSYIRSGLSSFKHLLIPLSLEKHGFSKKSALSSYGTINGMVMPVLMFPSILISSFSGLLVPEFSRLNVGSNKSIIKKYISKIFKITIIFSLLISVFIFIFSNKISIFLYKNSDIAIYLKLLSPLVLFIYLDNVIDNILKGLGRQLDVMFCNILDLIVSILYIFFAIPNLGIRGYLIMFYISEILNFTISLFQLRKFLNKRT